MSEPRHIATITKNNAEEVRVSLTTFRGFDLVDVRTYADFDGSAGERRATKKGICLSRSKLRDLIKALERAERDGAA